jgi:hypothetical protein
LQARLTEKFFLRIHSFYILEVGSSTSQKTEDKDFDDNNESDLEAVMQGLLKIPIRIFINHTL